MTSALTGITPSSNISRLHTYRRYRNAPCITQKGLYFFKKTRERYTFLLKSDNPSQLPYENRLYRRLSPIYHLACLIQLKLVAAFRLMEQPWNLPYSYLMRQLSLGIPYLYISARLHLLANQCEMATKSPQTGHYP